MPAGAELPLDTLLDVVIAVSIGLFIGLEREQQRATEYADRPHEIPLGARSFALIALFGWLASHAADRFAWLPVVGLLALGAVITVAGILAQRAGHGLTTELAALVTFGLGLIVASERLLAVALAVVTALLLVSKPTVRKLATAIRRADVTATVQLALLFAIVLPLLPTEASDPWGVLAPRRLGLFIALIAAISYVGYLVHRVLGPSRGAAVTGLVGGLVSSTAVTAAMARHASRSATMIAPGQLAILLACAVMTVRVAVIGSSLAPAIAPTLIPTMAGALVVIVAAAAWRWRASRRVVAAEPATVELDNPFSLVPALTWGALFAVVLVAVAVAQNQLGDAGLLATTALSGIADVDAATLAITRQSALGTIEPGLATLAITAAVATNHATKVLIAWSQAGRALGRPLAVILGVAAVVALVIASAV